VRQADPVDGTTNDSYDGFVVVYLPWGHEQTTSNAMGLLLFECGEMAVYGLGDQERNGAL
jgi:hypothetical protein